MATIVAIAALAIALPTGTNAVPVHSLIGHERSLLAAASDADCQAPEMAPGKGCVFLANCTTCTDSKCVANYQTHALEEMMDPMTSKMENETALCAMVAATLVITDATAVASMQSMMMSCPNDTTVDAATTNFTELGTSTASMGQTLNSAEAVKTYLAASCATHAATGMCVSKSAEAMMTLSEDPNCAAMMSDSPPAYCRTDPVMVNETCALGPGTAMGVGEIVIKAIRKTALELHAECQKLTTEADCHAFDGSAMLKMLNETNTAPAAGEILASSQERNAGYGVVSLMALMSMIML